MSESQDMDEPLLKRSASDMEGGDQGYDASATLAVERPSLRPLGTSPLANTSHITETGAPTDTSDHDELVAKYKRRHARYYMYPPTFAKRFRARVKSGVLTQQSCGISPQASESTVVTMTGGPHHSADATASGAFGTSQRLSSQAERLPSVSMQSESMGMGHIHPRLNPYLVRSGSTVRKPMGLSEKISRARFIFEVVFMAVAVVATVSVAVWDVITPPDVFLEFLGVPLLLWLLLAALLVPAVRIAELVVDVLVKYVEKAAVAANLENVHYTIIGLSAALRLVATAVIIEVLAFIVMQERAADANDKTLKTIHKLCLCFVVFSLVDLAKTLGCRLLSLRVNSDSLFDLLKSTIDKEEMLNNLMVAQKPDSVQEDRLEAIGKLRRIPDWSVGSYLTNLYELSLLMESSAASSFTDRITELVAEFRKMMESQLDEHAACAAEYLWLVGRRDLTCDRMFLSDFEAALGELGEEKASETFALFDLDGDGFVTEPEVHQRLRTMYRERRNLARTLQDNDDVINSLERLIGAVMHAIALFVYAALFGADVLHLIISLSSISVASAFVFGETLKTLYESVVFIFVIRPYQVGDSILYENLRHTVRNFGLLSTQLMRFDGLRLWVPNKKLMAGHVVNLNHSRNHLDVLSFTADAGLITPDDLEDLQEQLSSLIEKESARKVFDENTSPSTFFSGIEDPLKVKVGVSYKAAVSMSQMPKVLEARTLVLNLISSWLKDKHITHTTSVQPFVSLSDSEKAPFSMK